MPGIGRHGTAGKDGGIYCFPFARKSGRMHSKKIRAKIKNKPSSTAGKKPFIRK